MPAKRRERRPAPPPSSGDPPPSPPSTATATAAAAAAASHHHRLLPLLLVLLSVIASVAVLSATRRPAAPPVLSVHQRGLVRTDAGYREILAESGRVSENVSQRHFQNPVLAYLTPWNSRGYEMAKLFNSKLTHLSPVWYELKSEGKELVLEGRHNVDMKWISEVRRNHHSLVLPRIVLEAFPSELLLKKKQRSKAIDAIIAECKEMGYDGVVLESWSRWAAYGVLNDPDMRNKALQFVKQLGKTLHSLSSANEAAQHLELIYVIPPPRSENLGELDFGPRDLEQLSGDVDGFSLMTYDFSGSQNPGPNAPLKWVHSCMHMLLGDTHGDAQNHAHKIFLGINFYGNDYILSEGPGGGAILGRDYLSLLEKHRPVLQWEERSAEHYFVYSHNNVKHVVFYPSLMSISARLDEARTWGAGLSIWEIGQGLDYFFDLL